MSEEDIRQYYKRIYLDTSHRCYWVNRVGGSYLGTTKTLEEALYYRDLYSNIREDPVPRPSELDLKTDNPYLKDGLKYPVPERLQRPEGYIPHTPKGSIYHRSKSCYVLYYSGTYLCSCRTYEQGYYVLQELRKCQWDKTQIPRILNSYPEWYTWLLGFYRYITVDSHSKTPEGNHRYLISIPRRALPKGQNIELVRGYTNLEDALYERDFLEKHNWDYDLLVETINDKNNPYYNMELPPYPERKIRNIIKRKSHTKELKQIQKLILESPEISQREVARKLETSDMNIRNWLRNYDTDWFSFRHLVLTGEDPLEKLTLKPIIYQPDLSPSKPSNFKGYVHKHSKSKKYPWNIEYKHKGYGVYPTRELALKIVKDLIACNWDKSQLQSIQLKHGYVAPRTRRNLIYRKGNTYTVRKTTPDGGLGYYGCYPCKRIAEIVRDLLKHLNWNKDHLAEVKETANLIYHFEKTYQNNMFGGVRL